MLLYLNIIRRKTLKIFAISDLHLSFGSNKPMEVFGGNWENYLEQIQADWAEKVGDEDLVLIAGDISWAMKLEETKLDFEFLAKLKGKKVIIRGNHDFWWSSISNVRDRLPENVFAIQNDAMKFGDVIICGTRGWTVPEDINNQSAEDEKIYKRELIRLELTLQSAQKLRQNGEQIICMIHYPPFNSSRKESEFTALFEKFGVSKVVYGHLHGGKSRANLQLTINNIEYYLTSCDQINNRLVLVNGDECEVEV